MPNSPHPSDAALERAVFQVALATEAEGLYEGELLVLVARRLDHPAELIARRLGAMLQQLRKSRQIEFSRTTGMWR